MMEQWNPDQMENIISMHISQPEKPRIHMMTEAGIIGKIGLNSSGVGVTLNAVRAKGVDSSRLPCHLALRRALESKSSAEAIRALQKAGVAAACHVLIADHEGSVGLECTAFDVVRLPMHKGVVTHTNHFVEPHVGPDCSPDLPDTSFRLDRINELLKKELNGPSFATIRAMLKDEANYPGSINRACTKEGFATLFCIIMDLKARKAEVKMGRPTEENDYLKLEP
jgi:isopenicillin-N N-acyltransferase like protein